MPETEPTTTEPKGPQTYEAMFHRASLACNLLVSGAQLPSSIRDACKDAILAYLKP